MRYLVLFLLPNLALFLQSTLFSAYSIKGIIPDLVLVFVVFFAIFNGTRKGTIYGFACGLLEDLYVGRFIGINALSKAITAYIIGRLQGNVFKENLMVGVIGVLVSTIINSLFLIILSLPVTNLYLLDLNIIISIAFQCIYNVLLAAPIYVWYYNSSWNGFLKLTGER
ncbi:MAG: rod shape-determining protein MreD [Syntrophomonas sp.]